VTGTSPEERRWGWSRIAPCFGPTFPVAFVVSKPAVGSGRAGSCGGGGGVLGGGCWSGSGGGVGCGGMG